MTAARRLLGLALLAALLTAAQGAREVASAGAGTLELYGIQGPPGLGGDYYLGHVAGLVRYGKEGAGRCEWEVVRTDRGALIRVGSSEADPYNRWYLGYAAVLTASPRVVPRFYIFEIAP